MFMIISVYDPLTGYRQVTERLPTGHQLLADRPAKTLARNIMKTVSADCWPSVSQQLANSRLTVSFKNCSSLLLKNLAGTL